MKRKVLRVLALQLVVLCLASAGLAGAVAAQQVQAADSARTADPGTAALPTAPATVRIDSVASDDEIRRRLQNVLEATQWFTNPRVRVEQGVVFLEGRVASDEVKAWAGDLARNTQDVVAVANQMEVVPASPWDFGPARNGLRSLWQGFIRALPLLALGLVVLSLSWGAGVLTARRARRFLSTRVRARLLQRVIANAAGVLVFLVGTYIILRISGLTQLALTVVGGTGLVGLALGLAFRDITENFLASLFLSIQRPFKTGDLVEVTGVTGYVQQLNMRTTIVMMLDGTLVQIPNASVYKSNLRNFTTNCNRREDFEVGIGYDDSISEAQEIARDVLVAHPAVLHDPEPLVLVNSLGSSTVNLRIYFWLNGRDHSWLKVRSSVIRLVKRAFQEHGISMPDDAREVIFPKGVAVTMEKAEAPAAPAPPRPGRPGAPEPDAVSTTAEAGLSSEAQVIEAQARQAQPVAAGENLLDSDQDGDAPRPEE